MDVIEGIFHLAGWAPVKSKNAESIVAGVERRIGRTLPDSFRSLLLLDIGLALLGQHSNCDWPIPCADLGSTMRRWGDYDPISDGLLPFMIENQGVCVWAIRLDDAHDPRVFVEVDSGSPPKWQLAAASFSQWLTCQIEDKRLMDSASFGAQAPEIDDAALRLLRRNFDEGQSTFAWPGKTNYRFFNTRSRLLLWNTGGQCD
jgi:hypothetical protein